MRLESAAAAVVVVVVVGTTGNDSVGNWGPALEDEDDGDVG